MFIYVSFSGNGIVLGLGTAGLDYKTDQSRGGIPSLCDSRMRFVPSSLNH